MLCASHRSSPTDVPQDVSARSPQGLHTPHLGLWDSGPSRVLLPANFAAVFTLTHVCRRERRHGSRPVAALRSPGLRGVCPMCRPVSRACCFHLYQTIPAAFKREKRTKSVAQPGLARLESTGLKALLPRSLSSHTSNSSYAASGWCVAPVIWFDGIFAFRHHGGFLSAESNYVIKQEHSGALSSISVGLLLSSHRPPGENALISISLVRNPGSERPRVSPQVTCMDSARAVRTPIFVISRWEVARISSDEVGIPE